MWILLLIDGTIPVAQYQAFLAKNQTLCDSFWECLNSQATSFDARLRMSLVRLYRYLWGRGTPHCLDVPPGAVSLQLMKLYMGKADPKSG